MRITINNKQKQISKNAAERIKAKIESLFSKYNSHVTSIELLVQDINGPRGGLDKRCQILVKLRKMDAVVVAVEETTFSTAISRAITKAQQATGRKVKRRTVRSAVRRPEFGFAFQN